MSMHKHLVA